MNNRKKIVLLLLYGSIGLSGTPLFAQWRKINQLTVPYPSLSNIVFSAGTLTFKNGKLWLGIADSLWMSPDTGKTWINRHFPKTVAQNSIESVAFFNDSVGVVGSEFENPYLTTDQGISWNQLPVIPGGNCSITFAGSPKNIICTGYWGIFTTTDQGNTWINPEKFDKLDVHFSSHGNAFAIDGNLLVSNDLGLSWKRQPGKFDYDSYSFDLDPCDDDILYVANEDATVTLDKKSNIFVTRNQGLLWKSGFDAGIPYICGSVAVARNAIYAQTTTGGILRSTDQGQTWKSIGGPSVYWDTRMVVAVTENEVIAVDNDVSVWITFNSGGSPVSPNYLPFIKEASFGNPSSCVNDTAFASLTARGCGRTTITNITIEGKDSNNFSLNTINLPSLLQTDSTFNIGLGFHPHNEPRAFSTFLHIKGYFEDSNGREYLDTIISVKAIANEPAPDLSGTPRSILFDTISLCTSPLDSIVVLRNTGCDTLTIVSGPGAHDPAYTIDPISLPVTIAPDSSLMVHIHFNPTSQGRKLGDMLFHCYQRDPKNTQDLTISIEGNVKNEGGVFAYSPKQFTFQSLSICTHDSAGGFVTNIGCDSLLLDPTTIIADPDYKLTANTSHLTVKPGDTMKYEVYLNPTRKGLRQGYLVLTSNDKIDTRHDTVRFTVTVTDGTVILSSTITSADFGAVSICDKRDTLITLQNTGCDTLQISGISGLGSGFGTNTTFPIIIPPNHDTTIDIFTLLDTAGGKTVTTGTLTFISNSNNTLAPIKLSRTFIQSTHHDVGLFLDATAKAGTDLSTVTYDIKESPGKTFSGAGIQKINFDLNYNTDVLNFTQAKSSNVTSSDGKSFTITGSPIIADKNGILASVGFTVYLTKDSVTSIDMTTRTDTTTLPCGMMTLSMGGSATFDYNFLCGERSIAGFLNGVMPMKIVALRPNPAQDEIEIDVQSSSKQNTAVEIFDALGAKVFSDVRNIAVGSNSIHLDTKGLSGGMYLVRAGGASRSFVKVR